MLNKSAAATATRILTGRTPAKNLRISREVMIIESSDSTKRIQGIHGVGGNNGEGGIDALAVLLTVTAKA